MSILKPGIRVVRGPNWSNGSEDGGAWHLGSVVETSNKRITVHWDNGKKGSYSFNRELTIFDISPLGIPHVGVTCNECSKSNFVGIRWKCVVCDDFDLCDACYHKGNHSLDHDFYRINVNCGERTKVGQRNGTPCRKAFGIFLGAIVKRGPDWNWNDQDGGSDKTGKVVSLYNWSNNVVPKSERSGARVTWSSGTSAEYRICFQGKCDLIAKEPAASWMFFSSHLPVLDEASFGSTTDEFAVGNRVFVYVNKERAKELQQNHGGWNDAMEELIGSIGEVSRILPNGDIAVNYKPSGMEILLRAMALGARKHVEWVYNPACLKKVESFAVDDTVTVLDNKEVVEKMQNGHGGWIDQMQMSIGKTGVIKEIDSDGDVKVGFGLLSWTFSPAALTKKTSNGPKNNPTGDKTSGSFLADMLTGSMNDSDDQILLSAIQNDVAKAKRLLEKKQELVNHNKDGLTALHIACDAGKKEFVELLLSNGADVNKEDNDGDTALHRASLKKRVDIVKILVKKGVAINKSNGKGMTAFHCAAYLGHVEVMKILVHANAEVNTQDAAGDTPLHDAIGQDKQPSVEFLIELKSIDFTIVNQRGFNPLHHAVFSGKDNIVTKILEKVPELVNVQKEDGFAALHLAVVNGYEGIVLHILNQGYCVIDQRTTKGQTPFMLAATEGYMGMLKTLLDRGAEINVQDEDGDTSLHVVLKKHEIFKLLASDVFGEVSLEVPSIVTQFDKSKASSVAIACFLVEVGADLSLRNNKGDDVIGAVTDQKIKDLLKKFEERKRTRPPRQKEDKTSPPMRMPQQETAPVKGSIEKEATKVRVNNTSELNTSKEPDIKKCRLCRENHKDARFLPCRHEPVCKTCAELFKKCCECREDVTGVELFVPPYLPTCKSCDDSLCNVIFLPCAHNSYCHSCSHRFKKCQLCDKLIDQRKFIGPKPVEKRPINRENNFECKICFERLPNSVFGCGHGACETCGQNLAVCHICRKPITLRTPLYLN